ncbi:MAG: hypothetical protein U1F70_00605 [Candidatus Competibacteraceae bacterium]
MIKIVLILLASVAMLAGPTLLAPADAGETDDGLNPQRSNSDDV